MREVSRIINKNEMQNKVVKIKVPKKIQIREQNEFMWSPISFNFANSKPLIKRK